MEGYQDCDKQLKFIWVMQVGGYEKWRCRKRETRQIWYKCCGFDILVLVHQLKTVVSIHDSMTLSNRIVALASNLVS